VYSDPKFAKRVNNTWIGQSRLVQDLGKFPGKGSGNSPQRGDRRLFKTLREALQTWALSNSLLSLQSWKSQQQAPHSGLTPSREFHRNATGGTALTPINGLSVTEVLHIQRPISYLLICGTYTATLTSLMTHLQRLRLL